jgi:hypothetical protein
MPRDTSWEDVWAEYDARQAGHAVAPTVAVAPPIAAAPRARRPNRLALGGLLALLVVLLGLPLGEAGAPAVASQEQPVQRRTLIAVGLSGEAEMGESPAASPAAAILFTEAVLLPMPPPAWVQPAATPTAEPAAPAEARRAVPPPRRLTRASRAARQMATMEAGPQWYATPPRQASPRASQLRGAQGVAPAAAAGSVQWNPQSNPQSDAVGAAFTAPPGQAIQPGRAGPPHRQTQAGALIHRHLKTA